MNTTTITTKELCNRARPMDVLWGAWAKYIKLDERQQSIDIGGIHNEIWKRAKSDFPFITDLWAIVAYEASTAEYDGVFQITLEIIDLDAMHRIFSIEYGMTVPSGDSPFRWYADYELKNVEIKESGYYELSILVDGQFKQRIPLWVIAPKGSIENEEDGVTIEFWAEDYKHISDKYGGV